MLKSTYVQQCAHNLNERNQVADALKEKGISKTRRKYLSGRLRHLNKERQFFQSIKQEFILFPSDCFRL